jgi:hypothetical protein
LLLRISGFARFSSVPIFCGRSGGHYLLFGG